MKHESYFLLFYTEKIPRHFVKNDVRHNLNSKPYRLNYIRHRKNAKQCPKSVCSNILIYSVITINLGRQENCQL